MYPPPGERERVLAAVGWEADPRRRKVLRRLLQDHCRGVYLQSYVITHNKATAGEQTRRTLLNLARALDNVPEGCPLPVWIFLELQPGRRRLPECPEPWKVLAGRESGSPAEDARHREAHLGCRDLLDGYQVFLRLEEDPELVSRSGWGAAAEDLQLFLEAQFGDEHPQAMRGAGYWRQLLPTIRWTRSSMTAAAVVLVALLLALVLGTQWLDRLRPGEAGSRPEQPSRKVAAPEPTGQELAPIQGAGMTSDRSVMTFQWGRSPASDQYRLSILTPKLESLRTFDPTSDPSVRVVPGQFPSLRSGQSYLFRVDGLKNGATVASTGFIPFTVP